MIQREISSVLPKINEVTRKEKQIIHSWKRYKRFTAFGTQLRYNEKEKEIITQQFIEIQNSDKTEGEKSNQFRELFHQVQEKAFYEGIDF